MTKLFEWLAVLGAFLAFWLSLLTGKIEINALKQYPLVILYLPIIVVGLFGIYAATIVLYRVLTFNNCEEAAAELQKDIQEARSKLVDYGFKFKD